VLGLRERIAQFEEFNRWEEQNPRPIRSFEAVLADLSFLLSLIPAERRGMDPDPEKTGVQELRKALARIAKARARQ